MFILVSKEVHYSPKNLSHLVPVNPSAQMQPKPFTPVTLFWQMIVSHGMTFVSISWEISVSNIIHGSPLYLVSAIQKEFVKVKVMATVKV